MEEKENLVKKATIRLRFNFKEFLFHLSEYKKEFGNISVPKYYRCTNGYKLGEKVSDIRRGHIKLVADQMAKLNEIGFLGDANSYQLKFEILYKYLLNYKQQFGDLNVIYDYVCEDGYTLGRKISRIRVGRVKLTEQQKAKLDEIGFVWDTKTEIKPKFDFKIFNKKLLEYKRVYNNLNIPQKYVCKDGYKLGTKVKCIRTNLIKLSDEQKAYLNEVGFVWKVRNVKRVFDFNNFLQRLQVYKQQFGNLNIQAKYVCEDGYKLGQKIMSIRCGNIKLTEQQKIILDKMGFISKGKVYVFDFDKFYQHLLEYKHLYGNLNIKNTYKSKDGYTLGNRIARLRCGNIELTEKQRAKLDEIGFVWSVRIAVKLKKFGFGTFYKKLLEYKQQFGDCLVEYDYIADNYELGLFVRSIRNHRLQITDAQLQKLKDLDFVFNTQDYYKNKPDVSLIKRMANGDISARNYYIEKHMPIVYKTASKYKDLSNYTDLINVGYDALTYALDETNALHEQQIKNYVQKVIICGVVKYIKDNKNIDSLSDNVYETDNVTLEDVIADNTYRPDTEVEDKEFSKQLLKKAKEILSADEYKLLRLHFGFNKSATEYTTNQLARKYDTTPQKVERALQKIYIKLKQNLQKDEWLVLST